MSEKLLEVKNLRVSYHTYAGEVQSVRGVSFTVNKGETVAVVGESGCGKSVTAKSIMRLIKTPPAEIKEGSEIIFDGEDVLQFNEKRLCAYRGGEVAMVFQDALAALNPTMTVGNQIIENLRHHTKLSKKEAKARAVELLRMCLDAGYDRAQTLTAVNGMMLLAGQGERFTTVDLFLLDLWTGKASLDKLGAAGSYLMQAEGLSLLGGDALPLGILENVESGEKLMQLHQGDTLILLSDGVEDAYENRQSMEETIRDALTLETAQDAANAILTGAQSGDSAPADDQTVLVLRLIRARADAKIEEMYQ